MCSMSYMCKKTEHWSHQFSNCYNYSIQLKLDCFPCTSAISFDIVLGLPASALFLLFWSNYINVKRIHITRLVTVRLLYLQSREGIATWGSTGCRGLETMLFFDHFLEHHFFFSSAFWHSQMKRSIVRWKKSMILHFSLQLREGGGDRTRANFFLVSPKDPKILALTNVFLDQFFGHTRSHTTRLNSCVNTDKTLL